MSDEVPDLRRAARLSPSDLSEPNRLSVRQSADLFLRTWPYLKPQLGHLILLVGLRLAIELIWTFAMLVAYDVFNNKVLVGEKLEPAQAALLFLDDSYVLPADELELKRALDSDDIESENQEGPPEFSKLTSEQRKTIRNRFFVLCAIAGIMIFMLAPIVDYYRTWILQRVNQFLRVTMIERAEHLSLRYHNHARSGDAIYRVYQDSAMITNLLDFLVLQPTIAIFTATFSFVVIVSFSLTLGLIAFVGMVPILWLVVWFTPRIQLRSRMARRTNSALTSRIQEAFQAIRLIKANLSLGVMFERFNNDSYEALNAAFLLRAEMLLMRTLVALMIGVMIIASQYLMVTWVIGNEATFLFGLVFLVGFARWNFGAYQAANSRMSEYVWNVNDLIRVWSALQDMVVGLDRAFFLLDLKPDIADKRGASPVPSPIQSVNFENVEFAYDTESSILKDVSMQANVGTITAIVGSTGSGKSTLMSLLLRLYDPDAGVISINGIDLRDLQVRSLRGNIAIALQQNTLFAASVADNIAYATSDVSRDQIEHAARIACAHEFITEMPNGYQSELGERGSKLSTGQRQRLSIARAVVRDTPILILDEPTASLDAETEHEVMANLAKWAENRIVFLITHRFSTIQSADQIAVLHDGKIVECDSHANLVANPNGHYRTFFNSELGVAETGE